MLHTYTTQINIGPLCFTQVPLVLKREGIVCGKLLAILLQNVPNVFGVQLRLRVFASWRHTVTPTPTNSERHDLGGAHSTRVDEDQL